MDILEEREKIIAKFPDRYAETAKDKRFLALAICGEAGELANFFKKEWRDGKDYSEEIMDEIADIRIYLELLAKLYNIDGDKLTERVVSKMNRKEKQVNDRSVH